MTRFCFLVLLAFSICQFKVSAHAAEKPIEGLYQHQGWCVENFGAGIASTNNWKPCKKYPINSLSIRKLEFDVYAVSFEFTSFATTSSYCSFAGLFELKNGILELTEPYKAMGCKLRVKVLDDKFVFDDPERSCHEAFCSGINQSINKYAFPRWNNPSRPPL